MAISSLSLGQEAQTKFFLNVTSEKGGVKENISKTYDNRQIMEKDPFFKELGIDLPKGDHDKLVLETTKGEKKISLSTMTHDKHPGNRHFAWMEREDDVNVEILNKDGKSVKVIEKRMENFGPKFRMGMPFPQSDGKFEFDMEEIEGGNAVLMGKNQKVEVFAFEKDDEGKIKMSDEELDKTIDRLEKLIKELKAAKKNN
ncbi:hypothetical protein GCM10028791_30980 [Echinicola sediminis]